jgi:hypothetical protein
MITISSRPAKDADWSPGGSSIFFFHQDLVPRKKRLLEGSQTPPAGETPRMVGFPQPSKCGPQKWVYLTKSHLASYGFCNICIALFMPRPVCLCLLMRTSTSFRLGRCICKATQLYFEGPWNWATSW